MTPRKTPKMLIDAFVNRHIIVVLIGMDTLAQDENGNVGEMPMVCEGVLVDYDDDFILLGNERGSVFSLLNISSIGKIDFIDEGELEMMNPDKPNNPKNMN